MGFFDKVSNLKNMSLYEVDPEQLLNATSLLDFLPFIKYFRMIAPELSKDYFLCLFLQSRLDEEAKLALAVSVIYNADAFLDTVVGSIFTYFYYNIKYNHSYSHTNEVKFFILHCLELFLQDRAIESFKPGTIEYINTLFPKQVFIQATNEVNQLVKRAYKAVEPKFAKKYRSFIPLLQPRRKFVYSKIIIKELIQILLFYDSNLTLRLLKLFTKDLSLSKTFSIDDRSKWITSTIECAGENPPSNSNLIVLIDILEEQMKASQADIRLTAYIYAWLLTKKLTFLKRGLKDSVSKVYNRCQHIIDNPERELKHRAKRKTQQVTRIVRLLSEKKEIISCSLGGPDSVYVFKIIHRGASRTVALLGTHTLDDLHLIIQEVFEWENDHLYAFFMNNRVWSKRQAYFSPNAGEGPFANKKQLCLLGLIPKKNFLYLFDFGDDHEFNVSVIRITTQDEISGPFPILLQQHGKAPEQYAYYE